MTVLLTLLFATPAFAQTQVIVTNAFSPYPLTGSDPPRVIGVNPDGPSIDWSVPSGAFGPVAVSADGRFVAWARYGAGPSVAFELAVRDAANAVVYSRPLPALPTKLLFHPRRLALFVNYGNGPIDVIDGATTRTYSGCSTRSDISLTQDGSQLFVVCGGRVQIVGTDTLALTRELQPIVGELIEVNADGSRFATLRMFPADGEPALTLYDASNGSVIASALPPARYSTLTTQSGILLQANADRTQFYASFSQSSPPMSSTVGSVTRVFNFSTLARVGEFAAAITALACSPDGRLVVASVYSNGRPHALLLRIDPQTFATERVEAGYSSSVRVAMGSAPLAPTNFTTTVVGRQVTLAWQLDAHSPDATAYVIEARLTPTGPVIASRSLTASELALEVPPGTYDVTVRAVNSLGSSGPSVHRQFTVR